MKAEYFRNRVAQIFWNGDNSLHFSNLSYLPRWVVVGIDYSLILISFVFSFYVVNNITATFYNVLSLTQQAFFISLIYFASFFIFSTYSGLIRHSTFVDIFKIAIACVFSFAVLITVNYGYYWIFDQKIFLMPFLVVHTTIAFIVMFLFRIFIKKIYSVFNFKKGDSYNVLIIGVNDNTIALAEALSIAQKQKFTLSGFVSMTPKQSNNRIKILGKPIINYDKSFFDQIAPMKVDGLILLSNQISNTQKNQIVDEALEYNLTIFNAPEITEFDDNEDFSSKIKQIQIEDLLDRKPIILDDTKIFNYIENRTILVTGGAGSIGSEIVRQVSLYKASTILILDQAESPLHELELELRKDFPSINYKFILSDVRKKNRVEELFRKSDISVVFHAAAYKHVPMIEKNPREAIDVNILGTVNMADLATEYKVDRFVMVSTDKAVNPTNVMGASKRAAEIYVQALQAAGTHETKFITTRFGNVLGSNGSVIPHFKKQIEKGGPVTVTHKDIIRFFMTIPEACQLVLQAGTMGQGGEIFVFDMGKAVKIMDLAEKMIRLSGFIPNEDISIEIIGLRPGEKLYEELLSDASITLPTHHEKIMIAKDSDKKIDEIINHIIEIASISEEHDASFVVRKLKKIVPEFISKNSVFEILDRKINI